MKKLPFRIYHTANFFAFYQNLSHTSLGLALHEYFRQNKSIGSHDRTAIGDHIYRLVRRKILLDHLCCPKADCLERLETLNTPHLATSHLPLHVRLGVTKFFLDTLTQSYGPKTAEKLCKTSLTEAPVCIRANLLKTTRDALLTQLEKSFKANAAKKAPHGIHLSQRESLFGRPEFKEGLFEMQDEGSQLVANLINALPGQHVLDYCSGSGGKTLAFAPSMQGKGQIYLHDIRQNALRQARLRCNRAGVQNVQFYPSEHKGLAKLRNRMDWVLVDAPCSGSGTLRRHPEMLEKMTEDLVERLIQEQREIFTKALQYLKPLGRIVYATCSIFQEENENQADYFEKTFGLHRESVLSILPEEGEMDGFFAVVFQKNSSFCYP